MKGRNSYQAKKTAFASYDPLCSRCGFEGDSTNRLHVHHEDENPANNDLSNLSILCRKCHVLHHHPDGPTKAVPIGLPLSLKRWVDGRASAANVSRSAWILSVIKKRLDEAAA